MLTNSSNMELNLKNCKWILVSQACVEEMNGMCGDGRIPLVSLPFGVTCEVPSCSQQAVAGHIVFMPLLATLEYPRETNSKDQNLRVHSAMKPMLHMFLLPLRSCQCVLN